MLEVIIALTLVATASVLLISDPMKAAAKEIALLYQIEERRAWLVYLMDLEDRLPTMCREIREKGSLHQTAMLQICGLGKTQTFEFPYVLKCIHWEQTPDNKEFFRIRLEESAKKRRHIKPYKSGRAKVQEGAYEFLVISSK